MEPMRPNDFWSLAALSRARQAEMRREAKQAHLLRIARREQVAWWTAVIQRLPRRAVPAVQPAETRLSH